MREVYDNSNKMNEDNQTTLEYNYVYGNTDNNFYSEILDVVSKCTKTSEVAADMTYMNPNENVSDENVTNLLQLFKR